MPAMMACILSAIPLEVFKNDMRYINSRFTYLLTYLLTSGGSRNFGKGGPVKPSAEGASAGGGLGASPKNFEKLDAISCNLAYIFGIRMASDIIQNWALAE